MNRKDIQKSVWDRAFDDLDEDGNFIEKPRLIKSDASVNKGRANKLKALNPEFQKKRIEALSKVWNTNEWKLSQAQRGINRRNNPKLKEEQSKLMTQQNLDPKKKDKRVKAMKDAWSDPALQQKQSENMKSFWNKPENIEKSKLAGLKRAIKIMTPVGQFDSRGQAAEYYCKEWNVSPVTASGKILSYIKNDTMTDWYQIKK